MSAMTLDEALTCADEVEPWQLTSPKAHALKMLAAEVRRLQAELEESDAVRDRCARLLAETAVALKGEEKALHRHGWHDLPEVAAIMRAENTALRLYAPARRAGMMPKPVQIAPTQWAKWGIVGMVQETDEEFAGKGRGYAEVTG